MEKFKGTRTFLIAFIMAILPAATTYLGSADWNAFFSFLGPQYSTSVAMFVSALVMALMRMFTTTPPGVK